MNEKEFIKKEDVEKSGHFSNFFRHALIEEKKKVFTEAARMANKDQREVFKRADLKFKTR